MAQLRTLMVSSSPSFPTSPSSLHNSTRVTSSLSQPHPRHPLFSLPSIFSSRTDRIGPCISCSFSSSVTVSGGAAADPYLVTLGGGGDGGNGAGFNGRGGGGGGGEGWGKDGGENEPMDVGGGGLLGAFLRGWQARVRTDPQFLFKVLMEEVIGVGACVLGDMASRPNFGLNELDFVFSTIVVGSILNFTLMYMLAPASVGNSAYHLPGIFASCPPGHMFEPGSYSTLSRFGTFVYKGALFAAVGFGAGLVGTFTSTFLLKMRKRMDPSFEPQNKSPPTILNAATWALHMGLSSNLRYQALNGLEFTMAKFLHSAVFRASVFVNRGLNNVLGGVSFVTLARITGSQKTDEEKASPAASQEEYVALQPSSRAST